MPDVLCALCAKASETDEDLARVELTGREAGADVTDVTAEGQVRVGQKTRHLQEAYV